jgi:hypothetical protein
MIGGQRVLVFPLLCVLATSAWAQARGGRPPRFEDFPVKEIFTGVPAAPKITTPLQRRYRTRIREGVAKGVGVHLNGNYQDHPGPNFAGHMIAITWGCGVPCLMMALVDARTGTIHYLPMTAEGVGVRSFHVPLLVPELMPQVAEMEFRLDSKLMIVQATPHQDERAIPPLSYTYYFLLQDDHWKLLRKIPLKPWSARVELRRERWELAMYPVEDHRFLQTTRSLTA